MAIKEKEASVSSAEWQVLRVVWANPETTSQGVYESLKDEYGWKLSTVKTLLHRLRDKGVIAVTHVGRVFHYVATVDELAFNEEQIRVLLLKSCRRKNGAILKRLISDERIALSKPDIEDLIETLKAQLPDAPDELGCNCIPEQCTCGLHHHREVS